MDIQITARHFKAHDSLRQYVSDGLKRLERYYNGIVRSEVVFYFERARNSLKIAEIHVTVYGTVLKAIEKSDDFTKSVDAVLDKIERQLKRYKSKLHERDKVAVRRVQAKD